MAASINTKLNELVNAYYISYGSHEQQMIDKSVDAIKRNLKSHFASDINGIIEFGSYKRDTILPRKFDENSDIDLMVIFNHASLQVKPETYRNYLIKFAEKYYSRSDIYKDMPTVVLELDHIKYDLVPAIEIQNAFLKTRTLYIPDSSNEWIQTDPIGFNTELSEVNARHNYHIKRVIRLLKAWNAKVNYPISSYTLEQEISRMNYYYCRTLEDYFFNAITLLSSYRYGNSSATQKIQSLKDNATKIKYHLDRDNLDNAVIWLKHILPI